MNRLSILFILIVAAAVEHTNGHFGGSYRRCNGRGSRYQIKHCCSRYRPCNANQGDCDNDGECRGNLVCGKNNCGYWFSWKFADCCTANGGISGSCNGGSRSQTEHCCTSNNPCNVNQGDCDNDGECRGNLVCGRNNCGSSFSWIFADCCMVNGDCVDTAENCAEQGNVNPRYCQTETLVQKHCRKTCGLCATGTTASGTTSARTTTAATTATGATTAGTTEAGTTATGTTEAGSTATRTTVAATTGTGTTEAATTGTGPTTTATTAESTTEAATTTESDDDRR